MPYDRHVRNGLRLAPMQMEPALPTKLTAARVTPTKLAGGQLLVAVPTQAVERYHLVSLQIERP